MAEFRIPDFLSNCDTDTIHSKMLAELPEDIDKTEGGFVWDFTRPTALIVSELLEYYAVEIMQLIFPQYSSEEYLDMLAQMVQVTRRPANNATVELTITGEVGTAIPSETVFYTEDDADVESIEFETTDPVTIPSEGVVTVMAKAVDGGTASNVDAGTIILMSEPINGVETVTNYSPATGGTEEEDDENLRERVLNAASNSESSFIGNAGDYKRWAESVPGMGTAIVTMNWNGPETIRIVCIDANGVAANQTILDAIYDLIMSPNDPMERLAPPNTILTVSAPDFIPIGYSFDVVAEDGFTAETIRSNFSAKLYEYYKSVASDGGLKYIMVSKLLAETTGVSDFTNLLINGSTSNVPIERYEYPRTNSIDVNLISEV